MTKFSGFKGHGNGYHDSAVYRPTGAINNIIDGVRNRVEADRQKALANNKILVVNDNIGFYPELCIFCSNGLKRVKLKKIKENHYECPECNFVKIKRDAYEKEFNILSAQNNANGTKMSVQEKENVRTKKDARIYIRVSSQFKEELIDAKGENQSLCAYILDAVRTKMGKNVRTPVRTSTNHENTNDQLLKDKINALTSENQELKEILKKMIKPFAELGVKVNFDTEDQIKIIQNLAKEEELKDA